MADDQSPHTITPAEVQEQESTTRNVASGIYGLVVASATLATVPETSKLYTVVIAVVTTTLVYWVAEMYAHALARRLVVHRPLTRAERKRVVVESWGLVTATYAPLAALLVSKLLGATVETAIDVALVTATVLLGTIGWTAGRRSGVAGWRLVAGTAIWIALGLVMVLLKRLLH